MPVDGAREGHPWPGRLMRKAFLFALLIALFGQVTSAIDLPAPPPGFAWQEIPELKAAFLKPNGWFFKREEQKGTLAYFITQESIEQTGRFRTGLTVNVFRALKKNTAVARGKNLIDKMAHDRNGESWAKQVGPFQEFGCLVKDTDSNGTIVMHAIAVANPDTDTLYLFIFESPQPDWDTSWKAGKTIMETLVLDDEI